MLALAGSSTASAAELAWDGHYRANAELFNSLSLSNTNELAEGASASINHRFRLQPGWKMSDKVSLHAQLDLLPLVNWGDQPVQRTDPVTGETEAIVYSEAVEAPTTTDDAATHQNLKVTRVWAEVQTPVGQVRFGRVPIEWGTGMVFNAGNDVDDEFGDTSDRLQFTAKAGSVYALAAYETRYEGFTGERDDLQAFAGAVMYRTEQANIGGYGTYRWREWDEEQKYSVFIGDISGQARIGVAEIQGEFAAVVGSGDLDTGANDLQIAAFGANLDAAFELDKLRLGAGLGLATGDADPTDNRIRTFSFDPDFNRTLILFEEPLPMLEQGVKNETNQGRNTEALRTGNSISNAMYLQPRVGWKIMDNLTADLSLFAAQAAKLADDADTDKGYGTEYDLDVRYNPYAHLQVRGTAALMVPGAYIRDYEHDDLGGGFDRPALGFRLIGSVEF